MCGSCRFGAEPGEWDRDANFGEGRNEDDEGAMRFFIVLSVASLASLVANAELPRGKTRPRPVCGIPDYAYSSASATAKPTTTAATLPRVPAARLSGTGVSPQVYQLAQARMQVDHCYLSRVAVTLADDGGYTIGFRADQNPVASDDPGSPLRANDTPPTLQTAQLLRNRFVVTLRGYANDASTPLVPNLAAPRAAVVEWKLDPFTVERGKPYSGHLSGFSNEVKRNFAFIDRFEVEFSYR